MDRDSVYYRQVQLLVRVLPFVAKEKCFALKGGTAINLFLRDLPRLSVDIDLVYIPIEDRETSLAQIGSALNRIVENLTNVSPRYSARLLANRLKIMVDGGGFQVKIEVNPVLRGTVHDPKERDIHPTVAEEFGFANISVVSVPDLYGGKICAALDRQHPRDIYDVMQLMSGEGITREIFEGFLVYLISHGRPMAELLNPNLQPMDQAFENTFAGMTRNPIKLERLEQARDELINTVQKSLTDTDRQFLLAVKARNPDWSLLPLEGIDQLPAVRWKLKNLGRMSTGQHDNALRKLQAVLDAM
jgi:predicted nucleotidyltransferase component of viral defense system